MSHFIIRSNSEIILGTPNGHASTQFEQAMQRGLRAVMTRPSAERLIASAGQTSAQVGDSQCMHTTGAVCVDRVRSMNSRWIIECPLCVSHSEQAWTHAWQPMHRAGSMKNSISAFTGAPPGIRYCCGSSRRAYSGSVPGRMRTAQTLYSGILDTGSWEAIVTKFTLLAPGQ